MPVTPTYPGVYIEEVPSGVRTISGVATSIAAFAGWSPKGPADRAGLVLSWSDFERQYGGLSAKSYLAYGLLQFFANGGQQAYVVRLTGSGAAAAAVTLKDAASADALGIAAVNPGAWGNDYAVSVKQRTIEDGTIRFQLAVLRVEPVVNPDGTAGTRETPVEAFENLSMDPENARSVKAVIESSSRLIKVSSVGAGGPPANTAVPSPRLTGGADGALLQPNTADFENALLLASGGLLHLDRVSLFNLLCVPGESNPSVIGSLQAFCRARRAFLIADCAQSDTFTSLQNGPNGAMTGADAINSAFYFPWVLAPDPLQENRPRAFPPSGIVAGLYARTDVARGVWKAPAGIDASLSGVSGLTAALTDAENGVLNPQAVNCLRTFPVYGTVVWGARTLRGHNEVGSEWKYVPVRRLTLFLEESLYRGLKWTIFEPNDESLWGQIRLNAGAFLHGLFRQGAFQGTTPRDAYFVKCDKETTTQTDINNGVVNVVVGFAPLKPAEFVIVRIQQIAGQIQS